MPTAQLLLAVLSSSLIAGILGALIGGWFTLRGKRDDYANEYYKVVLARRMQAYEEVERLINMVKTAVLDRDGRPYHVLFSKDDDKQGVYDLLIAVMSKALWLSDELFELIRRFNLLFYSQGDAEGGLIEFGKENYKQIAELRTKIEKMHLRHAYPSRSASISEEQESNGFIWGHQDTRLTLPLSGGLGSFRGAS